MFDKYIDRLDAGNILAEEIISKKIENAVVLGIPRGGVVVAARVSSKLCLPLDIIIPRKIGAPFNPELAIGAVTQDGTVLMLDNAKLYNYVDEKELESLIDEQVKEIKRRMQKYRGREDYPDYQGKVIILVDDGIATGFTIKAALKSIKNSLKPNKLILAVPVAPLDMAKLLEQEVDELVCPLKPIDFYAVGQFYQNFDQVMDEEVIKLLNKRHAI